MRFASGFYYIYLFYFEIMASFVEWLDQTLSMA